MVESAASESIPAELRSALQSRSNRARPRFAVREETVDRVGEGSSIVRRYQHADTSQAFAQNK
jgi:hypothetical protein